MQFSTDSIMPKQIANKQDMYKPFTALDQLAIALKECYAPGALPGVDLIMQFLFRSVLHCFNKYDFGRPSIVIDNSCTKSSATPNLSIK